MRCAKPLFTLLIGSLFTAPVCYADLLNKVNIPANNIPTPIEFITAKNSDNSVEILFHKTAVPAQFYCYFAPTNDQQYKGIVAHFSSDNSKITFQPGTDATLVGGGNQVKIFSVTTVSGNGNTGSVIITLEGDMKTNTATIICAMQKIK